jgi:hypothetical protein
MRLASSASLPSTSFRSNVSPLARARPTPSRSPCPAASTRLNTFSSHASASSPVFSGNAGEASVWDVSGSGEGGGLYSDVVAMVVAEKREGSGLITMGGRSWEDELLDEGDGIPLYQSLV